MKKIITILTYCHDAWAALGPAFRPKLQSNVSMVIIFFIIISLFLI